MKDASAAAAAAAVDSNEIVLPTMSTDALDGAVDRMFDLHRKVRETWAAAKDALTDDDDDDDEPSLVSPSKRPKVTPVRANAKQLQQPPFAVMFNEKGPDSVVTSAAVTSAAQPPFIFPLARKAPTVVHAPPEAPGDELTGVSFGLVRLCATMSHLIYTANDTSDFELLKDPTDKSVTAEPILFDSHGALKDAIPPFCVAIAGSTMILAWRGSTTIMDWAMDFGGAPVSSTRWNQVSASIKAHGGYTSLVESELAAHEAFLLQVIHDRKIDTVVLTGHSLAGGMAQVAHLILEGQLRTKGSLWYQKKLTVRSVAIAAPMTTLVSTPGGSSMDDATKNLLSTIAARSCNLVYGPDIIPHGAGDVDYALDVAEATIPGAVASLPFNWAVKMFGVQRWANATLDNMLSKDGVKALTATLVQYQHMGTVIYYPAELANGTSKTRPVPMRDSQFVSTNYRDFRGNPLVKVPTANGKNDTSVPDQIKFAHSYLMQSFSYVREGAGGGSETDSSA